MILALNMLALGWVNPGNVLDCCWCLTVFRLRDKGVCCLRELGRFWLKFGFGNVSAVGNCEAELKKQLSIT